MTEETTNLSDEQLEALRNEACESLFFFAKGVLGYDWLDVGIHGPACTILEDETKKDVLICLPRGWQKSTLVSICYPIWKVLRKKNRNKRFCIVQNTASNAHAKLKSLSQNIKKPMMQLLFPDLQPTADCIWREGAYQIPRDEAWPEATFESAGRDTDLTGRHYDEVIKDDLVAPDESSMTAENVVPSGRDVAQAIGFHKSIIPILDPMNYRSIDVGTRWLVKDYINYHLEQGKKAAASGKPYLSVYMRAVKEDAKGQPSEHGTLTFPKRFNQVVLDRFRREMGPYLYACLYMNSPVNLEEMVFMPGWWQYYEEQPQDLLIFTTVDLATDPKESKSKDLDFTAVITVGLKLSTGKKYVLGITHKRMNPSEQINAVFDHVKLFSPIIVGIRAVQYEKSFKHWLLEQQRLRGMFFSVKNLTGSSSSDYKRIKIRGLIPLVEHGMILIKLSMRNLVEEAMNFPDPTAHDDILDALSDQLQLWQNVKLEKPKKESRDENPLSVQAGIEEILSRSTRSEGVFGELLKPETFFDHPMGGLLSTMKFNLN